MESGNVLYYIVRKEIKIHHTQCHSTLQSPKRDIKATTTSNNRTTWKHIISHFGPYFIWAQNTDNISYFRVFVTRNK